MLDFKRLRGDFLEKIRIVFVHNDKNFRSQKNVMILKNSLLVNAVLDKKSPQE